MRLNLGEVKSLHQIVAGRFNSLRSANCSDNLIKAIEDDDHPQAGAIMKVALFTGMRRGEIFKLKWKDVDFERDFITIRDPKGGLDQKIPLNKETRKLLGPLIEKYS